MEKLIFKEWKPRASSLGHIMTNLVSSSDIDKWKTRKAELIGERDNGVNLNGRKVKWTDNKQKELKKLKSYLSNPQELPAGAITHLDNVFQSQFWGRKRILHNKYLEKGVMQENDGLDLKSEVDGVAYFKNDTEFENDWVRGTPDNIQDNRVTDIKCNYDMESFRKADLNAVYEHQIKAYLMLTDLTEGELCYCLVNTPESHITAQTKSMWYNLGMPDEENEEWIEVKKQIERNTIFDPIKFKEEYPNYIFLNHESDLYIPPILRVKKFDVTLTDEDVENIKTRVELARKYLFKKEIEERRTIKEWTNQLEVEINK